MKIQYVSDGNGATIGVFIPIPEWNALKNKYPQIEQEETNNIPKWHKDIVMERLLSLDQGLSQRQDFDVEMDDIEKIF